MDINPLQWDNGRMGKLERDVIRHSIRDVIDILQNEPVRPDLVTELTVARPVLEFTG